VVCLLTFNYFLVATLDGLIDEDGLVEIKCILSAANMTPEEGNKKKRLAVGKKVKMGPL